MKKIFLSLANIFMYTLGFWFVSNIILFKGLGLIDKEINIVYLILIATMLVIIGGIYSIRKEWFEKKMECFFERIEDTKWNTLFCGDLFFSWTLGHFNFCFYFIIYVFPI